MKKIILIAIVLGIVFAAGIAGAVLSNIYAEPLTHPFMRGRRNNRTGEPFFEERELERAQAAGELYLPLKTAVTSVNIALSVLLMGLYLSLYRKIKTEFTIGLFVVTFSLFVYALTSNPLLHMLFGFRWIGLGPFTLIPDLFATVALAVLFVISLK